MAGKVVENQSNSFLGFEIVEGEPDILANVIATSSQISPWIDPLSIKLRHRIGRGVFGDVWLGTRNRSADDYEVAVKILHPINKENINVVLTRLGNLFSQCQGLRNVCHIQGVSVISGRLCIIMKFYEGSAADKMVHMKGGKLSLKDVLRYGTDLAQGIMELHSKGILILNLKPCNFLLNENDQAVLGDIGIPYVLRGVPLLGSDMTRRLGTPNYMAPEQWQPEIRGPISCEMDSWGFGCSIVEMVTGIQPWFGKSVEEIYKSVVMRQEKPRIPDGLPPAVRNVLVGCFEYDLRNRPLMGDVMNAFTSSQNATYGLGNGTIVENFKSIGYSEWFLQKDQLQIGDAVRSRKPPNSCKPESMEVPEGTIVGMQNETDSNGFVLVRVHGIHDPIRVHKSMLERVSFGLAEGDWVRLKEDPKKHSPVGILHNIDRAGDVAVAFIGLETFWKGTYTELQMSEAYCVGQFVKMKPDVFSPRFEWPRKRGCEWATGRISHVLPNGCLAVNFPGSLTFGEESNNEFLADPAEVELVSFSTCPSMVKKYQHLEDFHWAVRPILIALGLFTAMKMGLFVGKKIGRSKSRKGRNNPAIQVEHQHGEGKMGGNSWLPPKMANVIFRDGVTISTSR